MFDSIIKGREEKNMDVRSKKLTKSRSDRMISGVCGGFAEYLNMDPTVVRLIWVLLAVAAGGGVLAYIVAALIMPEE